jgi:phosphomannomutase
MIPWLLLLSTMSRTGRSLRALVADMQVRFPASGEINLKLSDTRRALAAVRGAFGADSATGAATIDETDGLSIDRGTWRVNVRASNTEPVLRVNVESRGDVALMKQKTADVLALLRSL